MPLLLLCVVSALLGRFCFLVRPFDGDAAIFIYMGKMVSEGGRLCYDMVDNKFPTVGLMTSVLWRILGDNWPAYIAVQTILSLSSALMLGRMAQRHGNRNGFWPACLFAMVYLNFATAVFGGFQLETVLIFFSTLAARSALIAIDGDNPADSFVAGLVAGCGVMLKPTGLALLAAMAVALWMRRRWGALRHLAAAGIGLAVPLGCALIYLIQADLLAQMPALWRQISAYAADTVLTPGMLIKPLTVALLIGFPMLVHGWINRRRREPGTDWPSSSLMTFALVWLGLEIAGVIMQRRMYAYHFLPIAAPAALVFGFFPRSVRPMALTAALLPMILFNAEEVGRVVSTLYSGQTRAAQSDYLLAHADANDAFWMEYWPRVALETGLHPGARYPFTFLFTNYDDAGLDYSRQMIADFERIKPKYIFLPIPLNRRIQAQANFVPELMLRPRRRENFILGWDLIRDYTLSHYTLEAIVGDELAYRRREPTTAVANSQ